MFVDHTDGGTDARDVSDPHGSASIGARPDDETYPGRRQLDELSGAELAACPVWWFPGADGHLSGPDLATVMPVDSSAADAGGGAQFPSGRYLLHARFALADGSTLDGHVTYVPGDEGSIADREPTLCADPATGWSGQVPLWHGVIVPDAHAITAHLGLLGRARSAVFPLSWESTLRPDGHALTGSLAGFAILVDGAPDVT